MIKTRVDGPRILAGVPHSGAYTGIGAAFGKLFEHYLEIGGKGNGIAVYHNDVSNTDEANLRSHACAEVNDVRILPTGFEYVELPEQVIASYVHVGPYDGLPKAWVKFSAAIAADPELKPTGTSCFEIYLNDVTELPPDEVRTELCVPVT